MTNLAPARLDVPPGFLRHAIANLREGVTVARLDGANAVLVFVNPAFERLTGYGAEDLLGIDCRLLQRDDRDQPGARDAREAITNRRACLVTLRNYRRDGSMFWNELSLSPLPDADGQVTHYIGIQKDVTATVELQETLAERNAELERLTGMLEHMALTDPLTGLYNRRFFDAQIELAFGAACRDDRTVAVFMLDVDHFKAFNDELGHLVGDDALRLIGRCIRATFTRSADVVARYGGEEFAVVCTGLDAADAERMAASLRQRIAHLTTHDRDAMPRPVTLSIGYAIARPADGHPALDVLARADACLYAAKRAGRDRCMGETVA